MKRILDIKIIFLSILFLVGITACTTIPRNLETKENLYHSENYSDKSIIYHSVLYYPKEISLNFPGILIGIEKSPRNIIAPNIKTKALYIQGGKTVAKKDIESLVKDPKLLYISHIVENYGKPYGEDNCALYNVYYDKNSSKNLIDMCSENKKQGEIKPSIAFDNSWNALDILKDRLNTKINNAKNKDPYTHIMVVVMGWNTPQIQAIRNLNSLMTNIKVASNNNKKYNPLFVGVTWPSMWNNGITNAISFGNKANDADEVGLGWLGVLLHDTLKSIKTENNLKLVVMGHSFGARASSVATCAGTALSKDGKVIQNNSIELLINLQGAYSMNRYYNKGIEKNYYPQECKNAKQILLTSSVNDTAISARNLVDVLGANIVGSAKTNKEFCAKYKIKCVVATNNEFVKNSGERITYINADELIKFNAYQSGGGAHSDIYREEMGKQLWNFIKLTK